MRSSYSSREPLGESQAGRWLVFAKVNGYWIPIGPPMSRPNALGEVAILKQQGRLREPHAVPL